MNPTKNKVRQELIKAFVRAANGLDENLVDLYIQGKRIIIKVSDGGIMEVSWDENPRTMRGSGGFEQEKG